MKKNILKRGECRSDPFVFFMVVLTSFVLAQSAMAINSSEEKKPSVWSGASIAKRNTDPALKYLYKNGYKSSYLATTRLLCGQLEVLVNTYCEKISPKRRPSCHYQELLFGKRGKKFEIRTPKNEETIGYYVDCLRENGGNFWVVLQSTNFGAGHDCMDCERSDYFDEHGEYLGSNKNNIGLHSVHDYKIISKEIEEKISDLNIWNGDNSRVQINLYPSSFTTSE